MSMGGHGGRRKGGTMKDTYFDNLKVRLFTDCSNVNSYEEQKDLERNRVNYGCAISAMTWIFLFMIATDF